MLFGPALKSQIFLRPDCVRPVDYSFQTSNFSQAINPFHPEHLKAIRRLDNEAHACFTCRHESHSAQKSLREVFKELDKLISSRSNFGCLQAFTTLQLTVNQFWSSLQIRKLALRPILLAAIQPQHPFHFEAMKALKKFSKHDAPDVSRLVLKTALYIHLNQNFEDRHRHEAFQIVNNRFHSPGASDVRELVMALYSRIFLQENHDKVYMFEHLMKYYQKAEQMAPQTQVMETVRMRQIVYEMRGAVGVRRLSVRL